MIGNIKSWGNPHKIGRKFQKFGKQIGRNAKRNARMYHILNRDVIQPLAPMTASMVPGPYGAAIIAGAQAANGLDKGIAAARTIGAHAVKSAQTKHRAVRDEMQFTPPPRGNAVAFGSQNRAPLHLMRSVASKYVSLLT